MSADPDLGWWLSSVPPSARQITEFGTALNEATLLSVSVSTPQRGVSVTLAVLSLPEGGGPEHEDGRVRLVLSQVGRIAGSLRQGPWDDPSSLVERFPVEELPGVVESFGQQAVYGWGFLDVPDDGELAERLSFDWRAEPGGLSHNLRLFQELGDRTLVFRVWFDHLRIMTPTREDVSFDEFTAGGVRWWEAWKLRDPRTDGHGIIPAGPLPGDE
jgi:hypothetical protein